MHLILNLFGKPTQSPVFCCLRSRPLQPDPAITLRFHVNVTLRCCCSGNFKFGVPATAEDETGAHRAGGCARVGRAGRHRPDNESQHSGGGTGVHRVAARRSSSGVEHSGRRSETRGPDNWAPFTKKLPQHHPPQPQQTNYWAPLTRKQGNARRPDGRRACEQSLTTRGSSQREDRVTVQGRRRKPMGGDPRSTHTHRTGPTTAERATTTRRNLRREEQVTVQGP